MMLLRNCSLERRVVVMANTAPIHSNISNATAGTAECICGVNASRFSTVAHKVHVAAVESKRNLLVEVIWAHS